MKFKKFKIENAKSELKDSIYNVVYINYEKKDGIKVISNEKDALNFNRFSDGDFEDFYKLYLFNDNFMITVYKFDKNDFKYSEIKKEEFEEFKIKEIYIEHENLKKVKVRIGTLKENSEEAMQFIGFIGGDM